MPRKSNINKNEICTKGGLIAKKLLKFTQQLWSRRGYCWYRLQNYLDVYIYKRHFNKKIY